MKAEDRANLQGYLRKWKSEKLFVYSCFFIDLLEAAACLSAAFQEKNVNAVTVSIAMAKAKKHLFALKEKEADKLTTVKYYLALVNDGYYQGVQLPGLDNAVDQLKNGNKFIDLMSDAIEKRCEGADDMLAMICFQTILKLSDQFQEALKQQGFSSSSTDLLEEWHDLVDYTATFLAPSSTSYRATWYKLFHSSLMTSRWSNIMLVVRLLFCLPVSNATVERFFGSLKRVKTGSRSTLGQKTTEDILTIMTEGRPLEEYDSTEAVQSWHFSKSRRLIKRPKRVTRQEDRRNQESLRLPQTLTLMTRSMNNLLYNKRLAL